MATLEMEGAKGQAKGWLMALGGPKACGEVMTRPTNIKKERKVINVWYAIQ